VLEEAREGDACHRREGGVSDRRLGVGAAAAGNRRILSGSLLANFSLHVELQCYYRCFWAALDVHALALALVHMAWWQQQRLGMMLALYDLVLLGGGVAVSSSREREREAGRVGAGACHERKHDTDAPR
jgi:hypothetical protein